MPYSGYIFSIYTQSVLASTTPKTAKLSFQIFIRLASRSKIHRLNKRALLKINFCFAYTTQGQVSTWYGVLHFTSQARGHRANRG